MSIVYNVEECVFVEDLVKDCEQYLLSFDYICEYRAFPIGLMFPGILCTKYEISNKLLPKMSMCDVGPTKYLLWCLRVPPNFYKDVLRVGLASISSVYGRSGVYFMDCISPCIPNLIWVGFSVIARLKNGCSTVYKRYIERLCRDVKSTVIEYIKLYTDAYLKSS